VASSDDLDNSMGLSAAERAYIRYIEREGLGRGGGGRMTWRERTPRGTPQRRRRRAATAVRAVAEVATTTAALAVTPVARRHRHK
jgi:hypothetical protein